MIIEINALDSDALRILFKSEEFKKKLNERVGGFRESTESEQSSLTKEVLVKFAELTSCLITNYPSERDSDGSLLAELRKNVELLIGCNKYKM